MKKNLALLSVFLFFIIHTSLAQQPDWLNSLNKSSGSVTGIFGDPFFVDKSGDIFTGCNYGGTLTMNGITISSMGMPNSMKDFVLFKVSAQGKAVWAKSTHGPASYGLLTMASDGRNGCLIVGKTDSSIQIGSKTLNITGKGGIYLADYDSSGNVSRLSLLAQNALLEASSLSSFLQIIADSNKNTYLSEISAGPVVFDTFSHIINPSDTENHINIVKYDSIGRGVWLNSDLHALSAQTSALTNDSKGNIYIAGQFNGTLYQKNNVVFINNSAGGGEDAFIAKYSKTGLLLWAGHIQGLGDETISSITFDIKDNMYITGSYSGELSAGGA